jgi:hypothetical protein
VDTQSAWEGSEFLKRLAEEEYDGDIEVLHFFFLSHILGSKEEKGGT